MSTDSHELIGQALGTCTLQRLIGRGGMGAVYLARQSRPRRTVAVKVLKPGAFLESQTRGEFLARFRREADAVAALDHVNIMPIYEYGEQEDLAYLVMPYVTGGTLRQLLEKRGILPLNEVINIISQAAAALDSAHAHGIIHRDLKPANMLFHADGRLLLADFGLAKTINETREFESSGNGHTALTSAGTIVGTPEYLAPEQGTGKHVDARTDVYSLGIVLFQMLGGRVPFSGVSPVAVAIKHALEEPPSLMQLNPAVTPDVEAVVRKAIAKDPADRYASAGDLARALRQAAMKIHPTPRTVEAEEAEASPLHLASEQKEEQKGDTDKMALHNAPTEANPRLPSSGEGEDGPAQPARPAPPPLQSGQQSQNEEGADEDEDEETIITASSKAIRTPRIPSSQPGPQPEQKPVPPVPVPQQHKETRHPPAPPLQVQTLQQRQSLSIDQQASPREEQPRARPPRTGRSFGMLLLGGLITLLLVAGVLGATYFSLSGTKQPASRPSAHSTPTSGGNTPSTPARTPLALPKAMIPAGSQLYGTNWPGPGCDQQAQAATWSKTPNASLTCNADATKLTNTGGAPASVVLQTLPAGKAYPGDYIIQVQVDIRADSRGAFGVSFRNQPGNQPGKLAFLITPSGQWQASVYDNTTGTASVLPGASNAIFGSSMAQGRLTGTITIDVVVQKDTFTLYVNGERQGGAQSPLYPNGTIGLVADAGAVVYYKNLTVYALS